MAGTNEAIMMLSTSAELRRLVVIPEKKWAFIPAGHGTLQSPAGSQPLTLHSTRVPRVPISLGCKTCSFAKGPESRPAGQVQLAGC